jgi:2-phosphosulfolactate phosphatase
VRFDWGIGGAAALAPSSSCLVIVDVLSFTTSVTVAVEAGTRVFPYAWRDETAADFARQHQARLAADHRAASADSPWSLSPAALRRAPFTARLVLPSPNGSAISAAASEGGATVVAACLRNANAVGLWLAEHDFGTPEQPVTVIAAGERWPDGNLRPALEDLLGAGAVIAAMNEHGKSLLSPEAGAARACFQATADFASAVTNSASGRELTVRGFADDVAIAAEINSCRVVPVLTGHAFTASS